MNVILSIIQNPIFPDRFCLVCRMTFFFIIST
nr:MAG TPA: hypothetical protein [Caudoviricetes sp.]